MGPILLLREGSLLGENLVKAEDTDEEEERLDDERGVLWRRKSLSERSLRRLSYDRSD